MRRTTFRAIVALVFGIVLAPGARADEEGEPLRIVVVDAEVAAGIAADEPDLGAVLEPARSPK